MRGKYAELLQMWKAEIDKKLGEAVGRPVNTYSLFAMDDDRKGRVLMLSVQLFDSDADPKAVEKARQGTLKAIESDIACEKSHKHEDEN